MTGTFRILCRQVLCANCTRLTAEYSERSLLGHDSMAISPLAGKLPPNDILIDLSKLERDYYGKTPDPNNPQQRVSFGTSGHRGSPAESSFNEAHLLAITQAVCDWRKEKAIDGPLFLGKDTHAADQPATRTALEVLAANGVEVVIAQNDEYSPTPVISHA